MMNELVYLVLVKLSGPTCKDSVNNNHEKTRGKLCWLRFNFVIMLSIANIFVRMLDNCRAAFLQNISVWLLLFVVELL